MTWARPRWTDGAVSGLGALAALAVVHHGLRTVAAFLIALAGTGVVALLRPLWAGLPPFVARWLGVGVAGATVGTLAVVHALGSGWAYAVLRLPELSLVMASSALVGGAVGLLAATHLRLAREVAERVAAQEQRVAQLERRALESRLAALSAQINPHFLFNTLNTLAEVVHEDEDHAEDLITDLAAMMRYALRSTATRVPLGEELAMVERLLRLEGARLGARLVWEVDPLPALPRAVSVPGLVVQALVENAVRHGVAPREEGGRVSVKVVATPAAVRVTVMDDGPGLPASARATVRGDGPADAGTAGAGGGLRNTVERVRLTWPERARVEIGSTTGACLTLVLPYDEEAS